MQKKDFIELIDLKAECKEYVKFRAGKSKKFHSFAEWDAYIESLLSSEESATDMYNLKRYCMSMVRSELDSSQIIWGYLSLSFPLILLFPTENDRIGLRGIALMLFLMLFLYYIISTVKNRTTKKYFYEDLLSIINKLDNNTTQ